MFFFVFVCFCFVLFLCKFCVHRIDLTEVDTVKDHLLKSQQKSVLYKRNVLSEKKMNQLRIHLHSAGREH